MLLVAAAALMGSTLTESAKMRFYCFLVFEGTVGLYCESLSAGNTLRREADVNSRSCAGDAALRDGPRGDPCYGEFLLSSL